MESGQSGQWELPESRLHLTLKRKKMGSDLRRVIVVDVEATCWETRELQGSMPNEVIEIGACEYNIKTGEISNRGSIAVAPRFTKVSEFCTQLTGWTQEQVDADGLPMVEALAEFKDMYRIDELTVWGSYGDYDRQMLSSVTRKGVNQYGIKAVDNPFDIMRQHINIKTLFGLKFKLGREVGLGKALAQLKMEFEGRHHNGADDALNIAKVLSRTLA